MNISLDNREVKDGQVISIEQAQGEPVIFLDDHEYPKGDYSTIIMYDLSAPYPGNRASKAPLVHYLLRNIPGNLAQEGEQVLEYLRPNPPKDSPNHTYIFAIYGQYDYDSLPVELTRENFNLAEYARQHQLIPTPLHSVTFHTGYLPQRTDRASRADPRQAYPRVPKNWSIGFREETELSEPEKKYCGCVAKVAAKNSEECLKNKGEWGSNGCYNPYAVCAKSTGTTSRSCDISYDYDTLTDTQLKAVAIMKGILPEKNFSRPQLQQKLEQYFRSKQTTPVSPRSTIASPRSRMASSPSRATSPRGIPTSPRLYRQR